MSDENWREFVIIEMPGLGSMYRNYRVKLESEPIGGVEAMFRNGAIENYYKVIQIEAYQDIQKKLEIALAIASQLIIACNAHKHHITITDNYIAIGCENHSIEHWKKNINKIAKIHGYTTKELKDLKILLNALLRQRKML